MILYHGTTEVIGDIDLGKCRLRTDFGKGFYMSSKLGTARDWATGKAGFSGIPTVIRFRIKDDIFARQFFPIGFSTTLGIIGQRQCANIAVAERELLSGVI